MEHLKIAIADDNQKILDLLDRVIGMEKDMNYIEQMGQKAQAVKKSLMTASTGEEKR